MMKKSLISQIGAAMLAFMAAGQPGGWAVAAGGAPDVSTSPAGTSQAAPPGAPSALPPSGEPFVEGRDPFLAPGAAAPKVEAKEPVEFSIHNLVLKGILRDPAGDSAIFVEQGSGASYILKSGHLFNGRKKVVHGVTGIIKARQKRVHLMTPEKDVQTFVLGQEDKDKEGL